MNGLGILNAVLSVAVTICIVFVLVRYIHCYNLVERLGHGLAGAASFISIFKHLGYAALIAPYNQGYQLLWRVGWVLFLAGKVWRLEHHRRANANAVQQAQRYFAERGFP